MSTLWGTQGQACGSSSSHLQELDGPYTCRDGAHIMISMTSLQASCQVGHRRPPDVQRPHVRGLSAWPGSSRWSSRSTRIRS
eukprot:358597-Chlamydomonas_euryale.AAC.4